MDKFISRTHSLSIRLILVRPATVHPLLELSTTTCIAWLPEPILFKACPHWLEVYCSCTYNKDAYPVRRAHELRLSIWIVSALTAGVITSRFWCQNQCYLDILDFHFIVRDGLLGLFHVFYWVFSVLAWLPSSRTCVAGSFASIWALLPIFSFCVIKPEKEKSANS